MIDWKIWHQYQQTMSLWHWGLVIVAIFFSIWLIFWLRSYFREDADDADETLEMLTQFRDLHQEGGLSDDEFRLIRSRLALSAQTANADKEKKPSPQLSRLVPAKSTDSENESPKETPGNHATAKDEDESERMTDKEEAE